MDKLYNPAYQGEKNFYPFYQMALSGSFIKLIVTENEAGRFTITGVINNNESQEKINLFAKLGHIRQFNKMDTVINFIKN